MTDNLKVANRIYFEFISAINIKEVGRKRLEIMTELKTDNKRIYKVFNFFSNDDLSVILSILYGDFNFAGFRKKHLHKTIGL